MNVKIQKIIEEKDNEQKVEKEKINIKMEEEIQKRLNEELNKRVDYEVQRKLSEELKKLEYQINNLKADKTDIIENEAKEKLGFIKKISMDIPEEIKIEGTDSNIEKLRKKNIITTQDNEINKTAEKSCTENCKIF